MDFAALRQALEPLVVNKDLGTHSKLAEICRDLGIPPPSDAQTKRERLRDSFAAVVDQDLPLVAERCLAQLRPSSSLRNTIQDLLWADNNGPEVVKRVRRDIARSIAPDDLYAQGESGQFDALVGRLFVLEDGGDLFSAAIGVPDGSLRGEIEQHVHRNPGDWPADHLFEQLGAYECCNRRFLLFLEGLASPEVRPDEESQRRFVTKLNDVLRAKSGAELREVGTRDGYPTFAIVSLANASAGSPKNLIFASPEKPDLRFRDAINNDIEIVKNADKVLVYDRMIGSEGIRWADLQAWWAELRGIPNDAEAKKTLYRRLESALPRNSPPQKLFFHSYFSTYQAQIPNLPALLPEVWLHWDPKTVAERGVDALARFRMDFLMLLPGSGRVVIEIDGKQHYTDDDGQPSPQKYAAMVAADRELRFAGYDLFRFGGAELDAAGGQLRVKEFFDALLKKYGVSAH